MSFIINDCVVAPRKSHFLEGIISQKDNIFRYFFFVKLIKFTTLYKNNPVQKPIYKNNPHKS